MKTTLSGPTWPCVIVLTILVGAGPPAGAEDWNDPAFDQYLNVYRLGQAVSRSDGETLLDTALQLREGERVLLREHRSGITSKALLAKALQAAIASADAATTDRIRRLAEISNDATLLSEIEQAKKLGAASRAAPPSVAVSVDATSSEVFAAVKELTIGIRTAAFVGDREYLNSKAQSIEVLGLDPAHKEALRRQIQEALEQTPETPSATDAALAKLAGFSRGLFETVTGISTPEPIQSIDPSWPQWKKDDSGGSTDSWSIETLPDAPRQPPTIDETGNVWAGWFRPGQRGKYVGKAQLVYNANGQAFWQSSYRDQFGSPKPVAAPAHNKNWNALKSHRPGQPMSPEQARQLLDWHQQSQQGNTRPTLRGDIRRRP